MLSPPRHFCSHREPDSKQKAQETSALTTKPSIDQRTAISISGYVCRSPPRVAHATGDDCLQDSVVYTTHTYICTYTYTVRAPHDDLCAREKLRAGGGGKGAELAWLQHDTYAFSPEAEDDNFHTLICLQSKFGVKSASDM